MLPPDVCVTSSAGGGGAAFLVDGGALKANDCKTSTVAPLEETDNGDNDCLLSWLGIAGGAKDDGSDGGPHGGRPGAALKGGSDGLLGGEWMGGLHGAALKGAGLNGGGSCGACAETCATPPETCCDALKGAGLNGGASFGRGPNSTGGLADAAFKGAALHDGGSGVASWYGVP